MSGNYLPILFILAGIILGFNFWGCSSSQHKTNLNPDYNFSSKKTITTYIVPTGDENRDEMYARVLHLDLQARGYKVIDANQILTKYSNKMNIKNHRQIADSLETKKYFPASDVYVIVSAVWDSTYVLTFYSEERHIYWKEYQFAGMNVPTLASKVSFFDKSIREPVKAYSTADTTYLLSENNNSDWLYPEYPWMLVAKQLSRELADIPICRIVDRNQAINQFKVSFWVDKSYREAFPNTWIDRLKLRTLYANDILRSQLDIELSQLEFIEWDAQFDRSLKSSLEKLYQTTPSNPGVLQIGITINKNLKRDWTDKSDLGFAYLLSNDAAITAQPSFPSVGQDWNSIEEAITLVHEIGHMLGAIHVLGENSIMYPSAGSLSYEFDELNKKIISVTKSNFLNENQKERFIPYSSELVKIKDFPEVNSNAILQPMYNVITQINSRSHILSKDSLKLYSDISALLPNSEITFAVIGLIEYENNNFERSKNSFQKVLEMDPDFAEVQYYLSLVLRKQGNIEESDKYKELSKPYRRLWLLE